MMSKTTKSFIILTILTFAFSVGLTALAQIECKGEGETIPVIAEPPECCEGLELIPPKEENIVGIFGICTAKCGNDVCDSETETNYNCPEDCEEEDINEDVALDEDVEPEDLDTKEPKLLPDSPLYFLKNWGRKIRLFFAFSPIAKAELRERFANEKLLELQKVSRKTIRADIIEKAIENYQQELDEMGEAVDKIKKKASDDAEVDKFLDKFVQHQALHQRVLAKLEEQVPSEVFAKIKENRERHLEKFGEVMTKLEDKENLDETLEENLEKIKGSKYKNFRNLEVLLELEEKVPEQAKEAIQKAQENALKRLKGDLEKMSPEDQEKFKEYLEKISGDEDTQAEILENLKSELKDKPFLQQKLIEARVRVLERAREKVEKIECPEVEKPTVGFCSEGRIALKRDEKGCIISFECVIPGEVEIPSSVQEPAACITLWDPVCGIDGKTYSNECFALLARVRVSYKGECRAKECKTDEDCPQPRCGPADTISAKCIGMKAKCVEGKCQIGVSVQVESQQVQPSE